MSCERCTYTKEKLCDTGHCGACDLPEASIDPPDHLESGLPGLADRDYH